MASTALIGTHDLTTYKTTLCGRSLTALSTVPVQQHMLWLHGDLTTGALRVSTVVRRHAQNLGITCRTQSKYCDIDAHVSQPMVEISLQVLEVERKSENCSIICALHSRHMRNSGAPGAAACTVRKQLECRV